MTGHTRGHVALWFPQAEALFSGATRAYRSRQLSHWQSCVWRLLIVLLSKPSAPFV